MQKQTESRFRALLRRVFVEREFYLRVDGRVRYLRLGSRVQMSVAAVLVAAGLWAAGAALGLDHSRKGRERVAAIQRVLQTRPRVVVVGRDARERQHLCAERKDQFTQVVRSFALEQGDRLRDLVGVAESQ